MCINSMQMFNWPSKSNRIKQVINIWVISLISEIYFIVICLETKVESPRQILQVQWTRPMARKAEVPLSRLIKDKEN